MLQRSAPIVTRGRHFRARHQPVASTIPQAVNLLMLPDAPCGRSLVDRSPTGPRVWARGSRLPRLRGPHEEAVRITNTDRVRSHRRLYVHDPWWDEGV